MARCSSSFFCSAAVSCPEVEAAQSSKNSSWGLVRDKGPAPRRNTASYHTAELRWGPH